MSYSRPLAYRGRARTPVEPGTRAILPMSEAELQTNVLSLCRTLGLLVYHTHDSRRSQPGFPDLVITGTKGVLFRELKSAAGKVTIEQAEWIAALDRAGSDAAVWWPSDWPERIAAEIAAVR